MDIFCGRDNAALRLYLNYKTFLTLQNFKIITDSRLL